MNVPNGWIPSSAVRQLTYDPDGRLNEENISRQATGSVGKWNSMFATESEEPGSIAPHLDAARRRDAGRRNYVIQPGGRAVYIWTEGGLEAVLGADTRMFDAPDDRQSFGHNSLDGSRMVDGGRMMGSER